jgi:hypothetical protein
MEKFNADDIDRSPLNLGLMGRRKDEDRLGVDQSIREFIRFLRNLSNLRTFASCEIRLERPSPEKQRTTREWQGLTIHDGVIIKNSQKMKVFELQIGNAIELEQIKENFDWIFMYNPLYLNFLGVCYSRLEQERVLEIVSEEFYSIGRDCIFESNARQDQKITQIYHLVHAVRGLHFLGKPAYFITPEFLAVTAMKDIKLVVPWFLPRFKNPHQEIMRADSIEQFRSKHYYPPEVYRRKNGAKYIKGFYEVLSQGIT